MTQLARTIQGSSARLGFTYDKAGNLREYVPNGRFTLRYTHDAWNRLVKVERLDNATSPPTVDVRGEYQYNGLGQRVVKRSDHNITDGTTGLDEQRLLYYSAGWQIVEERIDDAWTSGHTTDRVVQHVWGLRYIDDLVLTRQDTAANGSYENKFDFTHYALTDHQFSVVARIANTGDLIERIAYSPYGEARHQWFNDVNGDGAVNSADTTAASTASGYHIYEIGTNQHYNVDADFNRDGIVDSNDTALVTSSDYRAALSGGWIASAGSAHTNGYCGYVFNQESGFYTVRFRHYDPVWGRWISRDPAGYMDSMSLYGYGWGSPVAWSDPFGLTYRWYNPFTWTDPTEEDEEWERMINKNLEMRREKLRSAKERGLVSQYDWFHLDHFMTSSVGSALLQLQQIRDAVGMRKLRTAKAIALTIATATILSWAYHAARGYLAGGSTVYVYWYEGTLFYRIGASGEWLYAAKGVVRGASSSMVPAGAEGFAIPILYEGAAGTAGALGANAASNCVLQGVRVVFRGWGWPPAFF